MFKKVFFSAIESEKKQKIGHFSSKKPKKKQIFK